MLPTGAMLPLDDCELPRGGPGPEDRSPAVKQSLQVLEELVGEQRLQLLHDVWTVRGLFEPGHGPWRRAGFTTRVLARAVGAEMDRIGSRHQDPVAEAFWLLAEQRRYLNFDVVEERVVRLLFREVHELRPSQQRATHRLLRQRTHNLAHPNGGPASNLLLVATVAGGLLAAADSESMGSLVASRFPNGLPMVPNDELELLTLPMDARRHMNEKALAIDLAYRARQRP